MSDPLNPLSDLLASPRRLIADAARETGADFDFLVRTAQRESNFDPEARARTSSAAGLFQFIEQTWLSMMARHGERHGYGELAQAVTRGANGRYQVDDPARREAVLNLRFDARAASVMAGELAAENASILRAATGREPTSGELYAAHFLGAGGAARLIATAADNPAQRADQVFPEAAAANRPIFFDKGRPRSVSEVLSRLTGDSRAEAPAAWRTGSTAPRPASGESPATRAASALGVGDDRPRGGFGGLAAMGRAGGVLTPGLVELLASMDAPRGRKRKG
ncbi:transglycosylase SLT domain-containing protein [Alkalicaulis satelles]|uniref:Transglycosylase SLT domain-containing protein n=1 Tax=Alkalicaulis satelles TaxID=2609175 RepID=A0A5M6ZJM3_9PROT|nr:transglycosylase SLT domain-containing protein [Alkalicaulis satelles]KAA5805003.1 transglycosylase SLT domain-containing protein [Alkalicaulis satelles]